MISLAANQPGTLDSQTEARHARIEGLLTVVIRIKLEPSTTLIPLMVRIRVASMITVMINEI